MDSMEFQAVRETLGITAPHLSKCVRQLAEAGYLTVDKEPSRDRADARRLTWLALTPLGRRAFTDHYRALQVIAEAGPGDDSGR